MKKSKSILSLIKFSLPNLTKAEQRIANFILSNPENVINLSLIEISEKTNTGQATIIRFCKDLGVSGYSELKLLLAAEQHNPEDETDSACISSDSDIFSITDSVFKVNIKILEETNRLVNSDYIKASDAICKAKKICFFALGDAMFPCQYANIKFRRIGYTCYCDIDADMQIINAYNMKKGDVAIAVSYSGNSRHVVEAMKIAQQKGATTICITKSSKSNLTEYCDICLFTSLSDTTIGKELIARRVAEQAVLESLYVAAAAKKEAKTNQEIMESQIALLINKME